MILQPALGGGIIVGGEFEGVKNPVGPDLQVNRVASWSFSSGWKAMGAGIDDDALALASNGEDIMIGGVFQVAGGKPSSHIARWSGNEQLVSVEDDLGVPSVLVNAEIYPNPANGRAQLNLEINEAQHVSIEVFDMLGRKVSTAFTGHLPANQAINVLLRQEGLSAGMYMVRVKGEQINQTRSLVWY